MEEFRTVLLTSCSQHPTLETKIGHRVDRYINPDTCVQMINDTSKGCRRIDLFLSAEAYGIIRDRLPLFQNIYFHLYCCSVDDISEYERLYPHRAYIQVIEEDLLWVKICYAILGHDVACLTTNYTLQTLERYETTNTILREEIEAAKLGVQPD